VSLDLRFWAIFMFLQALFSQASTTAFKVSLSYQAIAFNFDTTMIGLAAAAVGIPPIFAAVHAGVWADRVGGYWVALAGNALVVASALLPLLIYTPSFLFVAAAVHGLGIILSMVGQQSVIGSIAGRAASEKAFATMFTANALGQMTGPLLATGASAVWPLQSTGYAGFVAALCIAILALVASVFCHRPWEAHAIGHKSSGARQGFTAISSTPGAWRVLFLNAIVLGSVDVLTVFLPIWGQERGISPAIIGLLLAVRAAASIVVRFYMARIVAIFGRKTLLMGCTATIALAAAILPFANIVVASAFLVLLGLAYGMSAPISLAWFSVSIPASVRGSAMGIRLTVNKLTQGALPLAIGAVSAGTTGVFAMIAILTASSTLLVSTVKFSSD